MTLMDRRRVTRFEFVESQWGSLRALESLRLRNFGREGLLIESATPLPVGSVHEIRLVHRTSTAQCRVAVRHLSPEDAAGDGQQYLIGLEFINLDDPARTLVAQVLGEPPAPLPNEA
jgi:hypothetical protein